ncbi:putative signal peptide-containing protein [Cryptosporidium canis]|uniref:Signal peptide-containing protein n=1 Tax=Cryptosporidium canis TaxID=195482 RepID=A0ABQ8P6C8_9CRYT|nr:putative signal peptide-containing protein [Cryptosporidium canis]KAJ1613472.1 putative signal peptide-containing protein [Cryptosporidium canis]
MNARILLFRLLLVLIVVSYALSEKKKQLMSDSEIVSSLNENLLHLLKLSRAILNKKNEQAKKKCTIAVKNLKTLDSAIENGGIAINPLTSITLNGIVWHSDPCNDPGKIAMHIELYNLIKQSNIFHSIYDLKYNNNTNHGRVDLSSHTTKILTGQHKNTGIRDVRFRSNIKPSKIKYTPSSRAVSHDPNQTLECSLRPSPETNSTNITSSNITQSENNCTSSNITNYFTGKDGILKELEELAAMKSVSSKNSSEFAKSLSKILSERINTQN